MSVLRLRGSMDGSNRAWEESNLEETALLEFCVDGLLSGSSVPQQWNAQCADTVCLRVCGETAQVILG